MILFCYKFKPYYLYLYATIVTNVCIANSIKYGLSVTIWISDLQRAHRLAEHIYFVNSLRLVHHPIAVND